MDVYKKGVMMDKNYVRDKQGKIVTIFGCPVVHSKDMEGLAKLAKLEELKFGKYQDITKPIERSHDG